MDLNVTGLEQLTRRLREMENTEDIEKKALQRAGEDLRDKVKLNVPANTGKLRESIAVGEVKNGRVDVGPDKDGFYGFFHEFGTSKMPASPFLRPTYEREKANIEKTMAEEIRKGMRL